MQSGRVCVQVSFGTSMDLGRFEYTCSMALGVQGDTEWMDGVSWSSVPLNSQVESD